MPEADMKGDAERTLDIDGEVRAVLTAAIGEMRLSVVTQTPREGEEVALAGDRGSGVLGVRRAGWIGRQWLHQFL